MANRSSSTLMILWFYHELLRFYDSIIALLTCSYCTVPFLLIQIKYFKYNFCWQVRHRRQRTKQQVQRKKINKNKNQRRYFTWQKLWKTFFIILYHGICLLKSTQIQNSQIIKRKINLEMMTTCGTETSWATETGRLKELMKMSLCGHLVLFSR